MLLFLQYYISYLFAISVLFLLGSFLFKYVLCLQKHTAFYDVFIKLFIGTVTFVVAISCFVTKGKTVLILLIPYILVSYFLNRKQNNNIAQIEELSLNSKNKPILFTGVFATLIFAVRYSMYAINNTADYYYYARLSYKLIATGCENTLIPVTNGVAPYHYFELWLNAGIASVLGNNCYLNLMVVTFSLLTLLVWLGLCAIAELLLPNQFIKTVLLSFLGLFITGVFIKFYTYVPYLDSLPAFNFNAWAQPKILIIYVVLIASVIHFIKQEYNKGILFFGMLPLMYITTAPSVLGALAIYLLIDKYIYRQKLNTSIVYLLVYIVVSMVLFYTVFVAENKATSFNIAELFINIKTKINIVIVTAAQVAVYYAPLLLILIVDFNWIKKIIADHKFVLLLPIIFATALLSWAFFPPSPDNIQLFTNIVPPFINVVVFVALVYCFTQTKVRLSAYLIVLIVLLTILTKDKSTSINELNNDSVTLINKLNNKNKTSVSLQQASEFKTIFNKNTNVYFAGNYLISKYSNAYSINLSVHQIPIDSTSIHAKTEIKLVQNTPFYNYVANQKKNTNFKSIQKSQLNFITNNNIDYIICPKNYPVPTHIQAIINDSILYNNDKFLFIK